VIAYVEGKTMKQFCLGAVVAIGLTLPAFGHSVDPYIGRWKLNLEKTKFIGLPTLKSWTLTWSGEGQNLIGALDQVNAQGEPSKVVFTMNFDGQPHPITGSRVFNSAAYTRLATQ
jgi:hypothetical protein